MGIRESLETGVSDPFGKFVASKEGRTIVLSNPERLDKAIAEIMQQKQETTVSETDSDKTDWTTYVDTYGEGECSIPLLGHGHIARVYPVTTNGHQIALKVYRGQEELGLKEFNSLTEAIKSNTAFITPQPYFATNSFVAMQFLKYQDIFDYMKKHPDRCLELLQSFQEQLKVDPVAPDTFEISGILADYGNAQHASFVEMDLSQVDFQGVLENGLFINEAPDPHLETKAGIFVVKYNPMAKDISKRYKFAVCDIAMESNPQ